MLILLIIVYILFTLFYFIYLSIFFPFHNSEKKIIFLNSFVSHLNYSFYINYCNNMNEMIIIGFESLAIV